MTEIFDFLNKRCFSKNALMFLDRAVSVAEEQRNEIVTAEHLLYAILTYERMATFLTKKTVNVQKILKELESCFKDMYHVPLEEDYEVVPSYHLQQILRKLEDEKLNKGREINPLSLMKACEELEDSWASYLIKKYVSPNVSNLESEYKQYTSELKSKAIPDVIAQAFVNGKQVPLPSGNIFEQLMKSLLDIDSKNIKVSTRTFHMSDMGKLAEVHSDEEDQQEAIQPEPWEVFVNCISKTYTSRNQVIGRETEMDRALRILCRKNKNNPLLLGEPGVGKTALVYGLAQLLDKGSTPTSLQSSQIYMLDMGSLLAGTSYHGEFEKRVKMIMDGLVNRGNAILFIDDIQNMTGSNAGNNAMSLADILKPYLESGQLKLIGATTYKEYNKHLANNKSIMRHFETIDIKEPSVQDTISILKSLSQNYGKHHQVVYTEEALQYAVEQSDALINDRFLPDKAIDIIDEAGAYLQQHPLINKRTGVAKKKQLVDVPIIKHILTEVCRIDAKVLASQNNDDLRNLDTRISSQIYGQDEAIKQVVQSVMMSKAGLSEPNKPIASLLFVGPTGVGKTEVCKVLAQELGVELLRFDMSEYMEKHSVSKLIGSPSGYVGYEEGGLLTDAIRKKPNCVLLLDEIEKAHGSIYDILLQVMDYAKLTDNKGSKVDFKHVILIMTSNAGAQFAKQASIGFVGGQTQGEAMLSNIKKVFKPEFLNRLSGTVVFNEMDTKMASLILDKKLNQLQSRLNNKNLSFTLTEQARSFLLEKGYTQVYGAREMDRIIQQYLTPLLMNKILFGKVQEGETIQIGKAENGLTID